MKICSCYLFGYPENFDTGDHKQLLAFIEYLGLDGKITKLIKTQDDPNISKCKLQEVFHKDQLQDCYFTTFYK